MSRRPPERPRGAPRLHFAVTGALLFGVLRVATPVERPVLVVPVSAGADAGAVAVAVEEAVLVEVALEAGLDQRDPFVLDRLAADARAARPAGQPEPSEAALVLEARRHGFVRRDPLIRRRLAERVAALVPVPEDPGDEALRAYLGAHAEAFALPPRVALSHIFFAWARGADTEGDARATLARLERDRPALDEAVKLGDPLIALASRVNLSPDQLDRRAGPGFADAVAALPEGRWAGPVRSSYGLHLVFVEGRTGGRLPELAAVRPAVLAAYREERAAPQHRARLEALRERYDVRVERLP